MTLRVVGAGLFRTGTLSLKGALERLLGGPCYHMVELMGRPGHVAEWQRYADGGTPDWERLFDGYVAEVDVPASLAWRELAALNPDAPVLLSTRSDVDTWWRSSEATIDAVRRRAEAGGEHADDRVRMVNALVRGRFCADNADPEAMRAAYLGHNDAVRAEVPPERLVEWRPGDGWAPLCAALGVPEPDEPFPHVNTTAEFRERAGLI